MAADTVTVVNLKAGPISLPRGVRLAQAGSHTYLQSELIRYPVIAEHLARAIAGGLISAVDSNGVVVDAVRILRIGRGIHAHTHDPSDGIDPVAGSGGGTGNVELARTPFTYASGSIILLSLAAGDILDSATVEISTPFDGAGASVRLGTGSDLDLFFAGSDIPVAISGQYESNRMTLITIPDLLILTVSPGSATHGAGSVYYRLKR